MGPALFRTHRSCRILCLGLLFNWASQAFLTGLLGWKTPYFQRAEEWFDSHTALLPCRIWTVNKGDLRAEQLRRKFLSAFSGASHADQRLGWRCQHLVGCAGKPGGYCIIVTSRLEIGSGPFRNGGKKRQQNKDLSNNKENNWYEFAKKSEKSAPIITT